MGNEHLFECLNSFEKLEEPERVISKCNEALQSGLDNIGESIVRGLLMSMYAKRGNFNEAQHELLQTKEAVGKAISLSGQELQMFIHETTGFEYRPFLDNSVDCKGNMVVYAILADIAVLPNYPTGFRADLSDDEKKRAALAWWSDFPSVFELYSLLGDLWSTRNVDYAIKCFEIVAKEETQDPSLPPTAAEFMCRYKIGKLCKNKGDLHSAKEAFRQVLSLSSHPKRCEDAQELEDYWITRAREELADIEKEQSKGGLFRRWRRG